VIRRPCSRLGGVPAAVGERIAELTPHLQRRRHRALAWLSGEENWCRERLPELLHLLQLEPALGCLIGERRIDALPALSARDSSRLLGQTLAWVAVDAYSGLNPNTLGLVAGCIGAGGWLILISPPPASWPAFADPEYATLCVEPWTPQTIDPHYLTRLVRLLQQEGTALRLEQDRAGMQVRLPEWGGSTGAGPTSTAPAAPCEGPWLSADQRDCVERIVRHMRRRSGALVLTADRGRGKTAAMGLALAQLSQGKPLRALVTAPSRAALGPLFERLQAQSAALHWEGDDCRVGALSLGWRTPDTLITEQPGADLLLIDEAAAIPTPILAQLSRHYRRILFATTQHGYEGNGRGFSLRFLAELDRLVGQHTALSLRQPIRWAEGDPLEALLDRLLLLDAEPHTPTAAVVPPGARIKPLPRAWLATHERYLRELFGLLILAHYRTAPGDLRVLLDSPNLQPWSLEQAEHPLGCALVAAEGALSEALAEGVWQGVRRPTGHLLPQALIAHEGWREVAGLRAWRILRIAIHPGAQQRGLGSELLAALVAEAQQQGIDYLGASFAASPELLQFWRRNGFWPVRVGDRHDPVSGSHAVVVVRPLSALAHQWFRRARKRYAQTLRYRLQGALGRLPVAVLPALFEGCDAEPLNAWQRQQLQGFAQFQRALESCLVEFDQLLRLTVPRWGLSAEEQHLLLARVWRQQAPEAVAQPAGRRAQLQTLRTLCARLLAAIPDA